MKVRACVTAAVIAAGLCCSAAAGAQEAAKAPPEIVDVARFFSAPRALGDAWERAVQAVLDGMRALVDADRTTARQALAASPPPKRVPAWTAVVPAVREVHKARRPVAVHPVAVEPVTETGADVRGQRAVLLGASVELPWNVP